MGLLVHSAFGQLQQSLLESKEIIKSVKMFTFYP